MTTFGERLRELRKEHDFSQKALAELVAINFTYLSKIENERLDFAQFPSEDLICKLATALKSDEDELLILAKKVPSKIKERVLERPDAFRILAGLDRLCSEFSDRTGWRHGGVEKSEQGPRIRHCN